MRENKFRPGYLAGWLAQPKAFRGVRYGTMTIGKTPHPALAPEEAGQVATYLESLRDAGMPSGVVPRWKKIPRRVLRRARILFQKKQPCYSCHKVKIRKTVLPPADSAGRIQRTAFDRCRPQAPARLHRRFFIESRALQPQRTNARLR